MAISKERLVEKLNRDLAREYTAIVQYTQHSGVITGAEYGDIKKELVLHAGEELQHALTLADQIDYLGGSPTAIDEEINFLDDAWCYHEGRSEQIMGRALKNGYQEKVFLMTKNRGRDGVTFRQQLDESLRRLQTDHIDLLQFHEVIHEGEPEKGALHPGTIFPIIYLFLSY